MDLQTAADYYSGLATDGYVLVREPEHPLANRSGLVPVHRIVLYAKLGRGPHTCRWCEKSVTWKMDLVVDHLDWNPRNNDPDNLVPSCARCNLMRTEKPHPKLKLTEQDVREIRASAEAGTALAERYGVDKSNITHIRKGKTWKHVA